MSVPCNRCGQPLPKWELSRQERAQCPDCGAYSIVRVFPALFYSQTAPAAVEMAAQGEAACFDHPAKRAVAACGHCGRFVCTLCAVDFKDGVWCPSCFAVGDLIAPVARSGATGTAAGLENSRTLYDSIALTVSLAPLVLWPLTVLSAPIALFLAVRYWRRPLSLVRRWRWRSALAILIALSEIGAWIWWAAYLLTRLRY
jgi:DNA-directed RNA polymerase subunit RPC12/RpoP